MARPNDDNGVPIIDNRHIPLSESERLPNTSVHMNATFWACVFVVKGYQQLGFTAHNTRNRLEQRMDQCQHANLWDHKQYVYSAYLYAEAIWYVYGVRLKFKGQP